MTIKYDNLIIYYFSGTGNARNAAKWIIKVGQENGLRTQLINIDRFEEIEHPHLTSKTLIGFCSPTHGFNLPPIVIKFIRKFPKVKDVDAFILNTRGGLKLHKLFLPGLSGLSSITTGVDPKLQGIPDRRNPNKRSPVEMSENSDSMVSEFAWINAA